MSSPFRTQRRVEWRDTDAAGIMHFSAFFTYMEEAEHELLRSVGLSVSSSGDDGHVSFPRVAAKCDYRRPAKFEDVMDIEVVILRLGEKSITYDFRFAAAGHELAAGSITAVCCRVDCDPPRSMPIPKHVAELLAPFVME